MEEFQNKLIVFLIFFSLVSCMSEKEKGLSEAYREFNFQVNDLKLDKIEFKGPTELSCFENKYPPKKNHSIFGWNAIIKKDSIWIYIDIDNTNIKEPSASFSDNFFIVVNADR